MTRLLRLGARATVTDSDGLSLRRALPGWHSLNASVTVLKLSSWHLPDIHWQVISTVPRFVL